MCRGWESTDAHQRRLAEQPIRLPSMAAEVVPLGHDGEVVQVREQLFVLRDGGHDR
jgi:hypothetical protein